MQTQDPRLPIIITSRSGDVGFKLEKTESLSHVFIGLILGRQRERMPLKTNLEFVCNSLSLWAVCTN